MPGRMDLKDTILILAETKDGNPLKDLPNDMSSTPFVIFAAWVRFWMGLILQRFENTPYQVSLEDLAEVLNDDDNPLKMLPEYEQYRSSDPPDDVTVPGPIFEEFTIWYAEAIARYIENKQGGNI